MILTWLFGVLMVGSLLLSTEVKADPTYDCTSGCWVVTCAGANCTLWRCDSTGCTAVSTFQKPMYEQEKSLAETVVKPWDEQAFVKVCRVNRACSLFELSHGRSESIGTFDNIDAIIQTRGREKKAK